MAEMKTKACLLATALLLMSTWQAKGMTFQTTSPDGKITVSIATDRGLTLAVDYEGVEVLAPSYIGMTLADGTAIGTPSNTSTAYGTKTADWKVDEVKVTNNKATTAKEDIESPFYRQSNFSVEYSELTIALGNEAGIVVRAYDEGVAYHFYTKYSGDITIKDEMALFAVDPEQRVWLSYSTNEEKPFAMAFQNYYDCCRLADAKTTPAFLPSTIESGKVKLTILESELRSYPGMFLQKAGDNGGLRARFAQYPKTMGRYPERNMTYVEEREDYIAKTTGERAYPWRIIAITDDDTKMPVNNLVYALSAPNAIGDTSWIKPGKVAWDWWNDWNLKGVDFVAGQNTETYKYFIDFASRNGIEYVVLDEGWYDSNNGDIMNPIASLDLEGIISYAEEKGVGIVLWAVFNVLDEHQQAFDKYASMGVKGFKIDFMDRDDQTATEMAYHLAELAAEHKMFVDFHGYYKPTGMSRTYPNILNYEGVFGMEEARWTKAESDMPLYDVTFPYIRMMAGNVDFTPGALRNGTRSNWAAIYTAPVSMGTRSHQLACYVVHDSPFTMLCDAPTNYEREQETTDMITAIPEIFEKTIIPMGEIGKYIVTAREKDGNWYVGGQANWDGKQIDLPLDFLDEGVAYRATIFRDGVNANHNAEDYKIETMDVDKQTTLDITMAQGGGFVIIIEKGQTTARQAQPIAEEKTEVEKPTTTREKKDKKNEPALSQLKKQTDDDITTYTYQLGAFGKWNRCAIYIVESGQDISLRLKAAVSTPERLSFDELILYCDGTSISVPFDIDDKVQDSYSTRNTDKLRERIDTEIGDEVVDFLRKMVNGSERKIIFEGRFRESRNLSKKEMEGIATVLAGYDMLTKE